MITVKILNLGNLISLAKLPHGAIQNIARDLADGARAHWIFLASKDLQSTRLDYINGIQPVEQIPNGYAITLVGSLPNMVEQGARSFDLHDTLLADGKKWHQAKDGGRYRAIPFRHKTPAAGPTGGQAMGSQWSAKGPLSRAASPQSQVEDIRKLAKAIHSKAKRLITSAERSAGAKGLTRLPSGLAPKLQRHHSTDIFAGMKVNKQAIVRGGKVTYQRSYTTFRMIAVDAQGNPRPEGKWRHPGITARNFADQVAAYVEKIAPMAVESYLRGFFE